MNAKKTFSLSLITASIFLASCGGGKPKEAVSNKDEQPKSMVDTAPEGGSLEAKIAAGKITYEKVCLACHQADGKGLPNTFPPLAQSDYLDADLHRAIEGVVNGLSGEITVNGSTYNQTMPPTTLTDQEVADAFTYVLNSFGNKGGEVSTDDVKAARK